MRGMAPVLPRPALPGKPERFLGYSCRFFRHSQSERPGLFRPQGVHDTKRGVHETISGIGEDVRKLAMVTNPANDDGPHIGRSGRITGDRQ